MYASVSVWRSEVAARKQYGVPGQEGVVCTVIVVQYSSVQARWLGTCQPAVVYVPLVAGHAIIHQSHVHRGVSFAEVPAHAAGVAASIPLAIDYHSPEWSVTLVSA